MNTEAQAAPVLPFYLALVGPTASGKTAAAMAIANELDVEVISMDSALVYRDMDIGTAKPSARERAAVAHHLIDIRDPLQAYNAAEFVADAQALIVAISARGKLPLLVGGTMLYYKALREGLHAMPKADPAIRAELEQRARVEGVGALHAELARVDPDTAARLNPADAQRIQRALEVFRLTGQTLSTLHATNRVASKVQSTDSTAPSNRTSGRTVPTVISLEPAERPWLHTRIAQRFDAMLAAGFLDEVRALRARGDLSAELPSMRCVGYRQAWAALDGTSPMTELRDRGIFATRQLAKRQLTWLRGMPDRQVVAADARDALQRVLTAAHAIRGAAA
ncbi:MAG: tRNA (adenosine(37)-N6)-dimethylallyltransferase MiaA [Rhodoferax sp.]|nr:tRNA (adenosine(37)-N6)-dimethylallyltransferase MiaA [Rhodoferax sp.]